MSDPDQPDLERHDDVAGDTDTTRNLNIEAEGVKIGRELSKATVPVLIVIRGIPQGKRYLLEGQTSFVVGRGRGVDIQVDDANVSRNHVQVTLEGDRIFVADMASRNGTFVNDELIGAERVELAKEDMIRLGNTILKYLPAGEFETLYHLHMADAAHRDALTGLFSRQYIAEVLEVEFKRAKALHQPMSVVYFDIDDFKRVNDKHGHSCGDYVLTTLGSIVNGMGLRGHDLAGRFGGEEFLVVLANTNLQQATGVAERIRKEVESHIFVYGGVAIPVTVSLGVATIRPGIHTGAGVYEDADRALYESKRNGKNRVTLAD
jgi:two-component system cell cycle response regulator